MIGVPGGRYFGRRRRRSRALMFSIAVLPLLDVLASITLVMLAWSDTPPP